MKSQFDLHAAVLEDQARLLGLDASMDLATLRSAVECLGQTTLTITLPTVGAAFEQSLAIGLLALNGLPLTRRRSKSDVRPAFMHGFFKKVFDEKGVLLAHPDADAVRAIRQVLHLHGKLKKLPTDDKVTAAIEQYRATDESLSAVDIPNELLAEFMKESRRLWGSNFNSMEAFLFRDGFLKDAKHGPGAVAEKLGSNSKWLNRSWTERLDRHFPALEYLDHRFVEDDEKIHLHPPGTEPPARVICVPKTAKTPRVITIEPVYNQFIQQGLKSLFEEWMNVHPMVSYVSQEPNRALARRGSRNGDFATIDLSEASDRVSLRVVKALFRSNPLLLGAILSCRSMTSELPDGTIVQLRKFASMGSALTFPIETLVFATIASMAVRRAKRRLGSVDTEPYRVYGDDIIVPTYAANDCVELLEAFGLKVNYHKSFLNGPFRESCGGDYFQGSLVTPVRVRQDLPTSRRDVDEVVAIVAFRNLYWEQYGDTEFVTELDRFVERIIPFPRVVHTLETSALVRKTYRDSDFSGLDKHLQRPTIIACRPVYELPVDEIDGDAALLKYFWTPFNEDPKHLLRAGRPVSAKLKYGPVVL